MLRNRKSVGVRFRLDLKKSAAIKPQSSVQTLYVTSMYAYTYKVFLQSPEDSF